MITMGDGEPMGGKEFALKVLKSIEVTADKIWEL
jgi:hypothetical protein